MIGVSFVMLLVLIAVVGGLVVLGSSGPNGRAAVVVLGIVISMFVAAVGLFTIKTHRSNEIVQSRHAAVLQDRDRAMSSAQVPSVRISRGVSARSTDFRETLQEGVIRTAEAPTQAESTSNVGVSMDAQAPVVSNKTSVQAETHPVPELHEVYPAEMATVNFTLAPFVLLFLIGGLVLTILLFRSPRKGLVVALGAGGLVFLLLIFATTWSYQRVGSEVVTFAAYNSQDAAQYPFGTRELPAIQSQLDILGNSQDIWTTEANDTHVSDTYASLEKLGRGVAFHVIDRLKQSKKQPGVITVQQRNSEMAGADLTDAVVGCTERLRDEFPQIKVNSIFGTNSFTTGSDIAAVSLMVKKRVRRNAPWDMSEMAVEYEIRAELDFDDSQYPFGMNFVEKPWVDDVSKYLVSRPGQMLLRARSSSLHQNESQARREAFRSAASQIAPQVSTYIRSTYPDLHGISIQQCERFVESAIFNQNVFVIDRFPQTVEVRGHDLWRESVLLNVDPNGLAYLARTQAGFNRSQSTRQVSNVVGMACLLVLVIAVCMGLNSMTKGYYRNPIVIFASVSVLVLLLVLS